MAAPGGADQPELAEQIQLLREQGDGGDDVDQRPSPNHPQTIPTNSQAPITTEKEKEGKITGTTCTHLTFLS